MKQQGRTYLRLTVDPPVTHPSFLSKAIEQCMAQCYGMSRARTYVDIVWHDPGPNENLKEFVVRVAASDAAFLKGALVVATKPHRIRLVSGSAASLKDVLPEGATTLEVEADLDSE